MSSADTVLRVMKALLSSRAIFPRACYLFCGADGANGASSVGFRPPSWSGSCRFQPLVSHSGFTMSVSDMTHVAISATSTRSTPRSTGYPDPTACTMECLALTRGVQTTHGYDPRVLTKLAWNFRSHPVLL